MLPMTDSKPNPQQCDVEEEHWKMEMKCLHSLPSGKDLEPIACGDVVRMQPRDGQREWKEGVVVRPHGHMKWQTVTEHVYATGVI